MTAINRISNQPPSLINSMYTKTPKAKEVKLSKEDEKQEEFNAGVKIIHHAANQDSVKNINFLSKLNPSLLTFKDKDGYNILISAIQGGNIPVVKYLLKVQPFFGFQIIFSSNQI